MSDNEVDPSKMPFYRLASEAWEAVPSEKKFDFSRRLSAAAWIEGYAVALQREYVLAEAWDEGFEAGATWSQVTPRGIPNDPPLNPYMAANPEIPSTDGERLTALSAWIDEGNAHRDPEAITWGRLSKVSEECGEVISAYIGATGQNPRKGVTHSMEEVQKELLDVAVTALGAVAHLHGNDGMNPLEALSEHIAFVHRRALSGTS